MAVARIKVYKERKRLSPWLWLLPLILLIAVAAILFKRHQAARLAAQPVASAALDTLPELGTLQFDHNLPTLTDDGQATLDRASDAMHGNLNVHLRLEGYADTPKAAQRNPSLAQRRTQAVARYLESKGLDRSRLSGGAFTHVIRVDADFTSTNPADIRRVELYVR